MSSDNPYIEKRDGLLYVRGSRIPLESLVWLWREGQSAETIRESYSTLRLAEVYGAVAFYLDHQSEVDARLAASLETFEALRQAAADADPSRYTALRHRFADARAHHADPQSSAS